MTLAGKRTPNVFDEAARQRRAEQAEHARRNGGPRPYRADEAGSTPCPTCDLGAWADSVCCPFCAAKMPDPGHYRQDPLDTVTCPSCLSGNRPISPFCDQCGANIPAAAFAAADDARLAAVGSSGRQPGQPGHRDAYVGVPGVPGLQPGPADECATCGHRSSHCPHRNGDCPHCGEKVNATALAAAAGHPMTSSAGRRPVSAAQRDAYMAERTATMDQQSRRYDLMAGYTGDGDPLLYRLSRCEALVEQCERDLERAQQDFRDRRYEFGGDPDLAGARFLDPERRERFADYQSAEAGVAAAMNALRDAKRMQSVMLAEFDDIQRGFQLGRTPDIV